MRIEISDATYNAMLPLLGGKNLEHFLVDNFLADKNLPTNKVGDFFVPKNAWAHPSIDALDYEDMIRGERPK